MDANERGRALLKVWEIYGYDIPLSALTRTIRAAEIDVLEWVQRQMMQYNAVSVDELIRVTLAGLKKEQGDGE